MGASSSASAVIGHEGCRSPVASLNPDEAEGGALSYTGLEVEEGIEEGMVDTVSVCVCVRARACVCV